MSSINVSRETKETFDDLQPEDMTQNQFVQILLEAYQDDLTYIVAEESDFQDELIEEAAAKTELAAFRGIDERLEQFEDELIDVLQSNG
jgi:hypothetical protein